MRYYIYTKGKLQETDPDSYEQWHREIWEFIKLKIPDFYVARGKKSYGLELLFAGAIDEYEQLLPFVLLYYEDTKEGERNAEPEYYATYTEMKDRYEARKMLIQGLVSAAN